MSYNFDVMHIEKNIFETIIGIILNFDGKLKDNLKSKLYLVQMGIHQELHPKYLSNGKTRVSPASFSMAKKKKKKRMCFVKF